MAAAEQSSGPSSSGFGTWLIEPLAAPEFGLPDLDGQVHRLSSFRGRPVLLNFWASWSPPCHAELEVFRKHHAEWAATGLQVISVNVNDPGEVAAVRSFARARQLAFPVLLASQDVAGMYNVLYRYLFDRRRDLEIPSSLLMDDGGFIVKIFQGPISPVQLREDLLRMPRSPDERVAKALPFSGKFYADGFRRNHFTHGVAFFRRGYLEQAANSFQLALQANPEYAEAHYNLGTLYLRQERIAEARSSLSRAVQLRPHYPSAFNNLGLAALQEGHSKEAMGQFEKAIQQNPKYATALQNLGNLYRQEGRLSAAQATLERAIQVDPADPEINYSLGMLYVQTNDVVYAREYLQKAVRLRPDYPEALNNLGVLYLLTGQKEEASKVLRECIRVAPNFDQPYLNLSKVYSSEGKRQQAQQILRQLLEKDPQHPLARKALADSELLR